MGKKINVAILGAGNIANDMAEALNGISDEVVAYAVASRSLEKAEAFAKKWGFQKAYGSYEELAKDSDVDLIYVATPHSEHYKNTKLCLENGRNCLVEKAFCGNLPQSKELIDYAEGKNIYLAEAMWTRYQPSKDIIRNLISEGRIGTVNYVESDFSVQCSKVERVYNPALAGGALLDLGIYSLTVPVMYVGTDIKDIKVEVEKFDTGVDATTIVTFTYNNGIVAKTTCSANADPNNESNYAKIVGDKGYIKFGPINVPRIIEIFDLDDNLIESITPPILVNGYEYEVLESKKAMEEGKLEPDFMPHSETIRMMGWMDSIRNHVNIVYPFETEADINHNTETIFGKGAHFVD
ncbi:MAG: Gfo/Idh/MocA family oxidoreductase [Lachnospiraceae bacterium]|nr:Gfo/Idh/MocA family oxidoreductase [Lachnospiraceae bacterium]